MILEGLQNLGRGRGGFEHQPPGTPLVICVMTFGYHLIQTYQFHLMAKVKLTSNYVPPKQWYPLPTLQYCHNPEHCDMNFRTTNHTIIKIMLS